MGRPRRGSSLGSDVRAGDTAAPALSTMSTTPAARSASRARRRELSKDRRRGPRTFMIWYRELQYQNTWVTPLVILITVIAGYLVNPTSENPLRPLLFLSYPVPNSFPTMYAKGVNDYLFVLFYTIFFTFTREFIMQRILAPLALAGGLTKKGKIKRFMEQGYTAVYFSVLGPLGLWVMYHNKEGVWYFNTRAFYELYPHKELSMELKAYYLLQAAYWSQQAIVLLLQLEKPRKDFKELVLHHVVTLALIFLSYRFHFTHIGLAVYITHDISDFFLATSKVLNYLDSPIIGPYFALFIASWVYLRHYLNLRILWSVATEFRTVGRFDLNWEEEAYKAWISLPITFGLLAALQAVNIFWLFLILRIAYRFVTTLVPEDERSDGEDEDDDSPESSEEGEKRGNATTPTEAILSETGLKVPNSPRPTRRTSSRFNGATK